MIAATTPAPPNPTSARRLAANRANAAKSTGPRTAAGKARSARNGAWHGLGGRDGEVALSGAERARMGRLRKRWAKGVIPGPEWECLGRAARAAVICERLDRIDAIAFAEARAEAHARSQEAGADEDATALAVAAALPEPGILRMLGHQTTRWNRALLGAFREFDRLRSARLRAARFAHEPIESAAESLSKSRLAADHPEIGAHAPGRFVASSSPGLLEAESPPGDDSSEAVADGPAVLGSRGDCESFEGRSGSISRVTELRIPRTNPTGTTPKSLQSRQLRLRGRRSRRTRGANFREGPGHPLAARPHRSAAEPARFRCRPDGLARRRTQRGRGRSVFSNSGYGASFAEVGARDLGTRSSGRNQTPLHPRRFRLPARAESIPLQVREIRQQEAIARLARLDDALGRPAQAASWRAKLSADAAAASLPDLPADVFARPVAAE